MKSGNGRQPHLYPLPSVLTLHKSWTIFFYSPTCFFYSPTCEAYSPSSKSSAPSGEGLGGEAFTGATNGGHTHSSRARIYDIYFPKKAFTPSHTVLKLLIIRAFRCEGLR